MGEGADSHVATDTGDGALRPPTSASGDDTIDLPDPDDVPRRVAHLSVAERTAMGRAARNAVPRASHAGFTPAPYRPDPIDLLEQQAASRVPDLVPIRYGRMAVSPFTFYRGAALIMASDLAGTPSSGIRVQCCGDAHLSNFGVFGSAERNLLFDLNDFDETHPGPWEWDLKRLTASLAIAARDRGFKAKERSIIVLRAAARYRQAMHTFASMPNLDVWYAKLDVERLLADLSAQVSVKQRRRVEGNLAKARSRDSMQAFSKMTALVDGRRRIVADPPLIVPLQDLAASLDADQLREGIEQLIRSYRQTLQSDRRHLLEQFQMVDMARKVVGVGSVGTRAYILLLLGRDEGDPLFLQAKEAQPSVLAGFAGGSTYANQGQRVVAGQHLMQASSDIFLGWERVHGMDGVERDFYIRQLRDWKGSADLEALEPNGYAIYGEMCAWTLARAHARSGDRIAIASYLGKSDAFDRALLDFSEAYADQNERDHAALLAAIKSGRLTAIHGV